MDDGQIDHQYTEGAVLHRLCKAGPLARAELVREFGTPAEDCIGRLSSLGLVNRLEGDFLIASAAGRHANHLDASWR